MNIPNSYMSSAKTYTHNPSAAQPTKDQIEAVSKCSSRLREDMPRILSGLLPFPTYHTEMDVRFEVPVLVRKSMFTPEGIAFLMKPRIENHFKPLNRDLKLADEAKKQRELYQQKLKELLSNPPPQDDFRSAHEICDMSLSTYEDAEFLLGMKLFDEHTEFSLTVTFDMSPKAISVDIPESLMREWIEESRKEKEINKARRKWIEESRKKKVRRKAKARPH